MTETHTKPIDRLDEEMKPMQLKYIGTFAKMPGHNGAWSKIHLYHSRDGDEFLIAETPSGGYEVFVPVYDGNDAQATIDAMWERLGGHPRDWSTNMIEQQIGQDDHGDDSDPWVKLLKQVLAERENETREWVERSSAE